MRSKPSVFDNLTHATVTQVRPGSGSDRVPNLEHPGRKNGWDSWDTGLFGLGTHFRIRVDLIDHAFVFFVDHAAFHLQRRR